MLRSIIAITFLFLISFPDASALAENSGEERKLTPQGLTHDWEFSPNISENLLRHNSTDSRDGEYTLKPNSPLSEDPELKMLLPSSVDSEVHYYIGAYIDEDESVPEDEGQEPAEEEDDWAVQLEAGFERKLSDRAAIDLGYRYTSTPVELGFDAFQLPSVHEHHFSAGMEFYF
ncbi:MAG: hypothetical protein R6V08_09835 [Desulfuromonadales bacterium]